MSIPRHILQIALGEDYLKKLPLNLIKDNIVRLNPGYIYTLLTYPECVIFLKSNFPEHLELFNSLERPQYKCDLMRYLYLYMNGGYYVDIDLLPIVGFDDINKKMDYPDAFFTLGAHKRNNQYIECANGFMGSNPKNPIYIQLVKEMYSDINPRDYGMNVKRMYSHISNKMEVEPFKKINNIYFLEEYCLNNKYMIRSGINNNVSYSNDSGYPYNLPK